MIARKNACAALALVMVAATALAADNERSRSDVLFMSDGTYAPFKTKPAKDLMTREEYRDYLDALNKLDCKQAEEQLRGAFVRSYPQFSTTIKRAPETNAEAADVKSYRWGIYAGVQFVGYGFCGSYTRFLELENQISQSKIPARKYIARTIDQDNYYDKSLLSLRDNSLAAMIVSADKGYVPALITIAQLLRRGDLFDIGSETEVEFYLLQRVCYLGRECSLVDARVQELGTRISSTRRAEITKKAQKERAFVYDVFDRAARL